MDQSPLTTLCWQTPFGHRFIEGGTVHMAIGSQGLMLKENHPDARDEDQFWCLTMRFQGETPQMWFPRDLFESEGLLEGSRIFIQVNSWTEPHGEALVLTGAEEAWKSAAGELGTIGTGEMTYKVIVAGDAFIGDHRFYKLRFERQPQ